MQLITCDVWWEGTKPEERKWVIAFMVWHEIRGSGMGNLLQRISLSIALFSAVDSSLCYQSCLLPLRRLICSYSAFVAPPTSIQRDPAYRGVSPRDSIFQRLALLGVFLWYCGSLGTSQVPHYHLSFRSCAALSMLQASGWVGCEGQGEDQGQGHAQRLGQCQGPSQRASVSELPLPHPN
jgi:hypothetical protein